ncbi:hypothetical protein [Candidatus Pantoea multigeneris]|uniref:Uncharacterized protein n=1 Tax=Candidatus Pantoea multigeneris TaxID=2608357 RepID=A0ABX0R7A5_9GAMM|nr:hypothetical protein [Pantoea multigeneris]NIF20222.1 hypothetical protein [Pantoea multigeneris]
MVVNSKLFIIAPVLLFYSLQAAAVEKINGVLQAYWLPIWDEQNVNHPILSLRFLRQEKGHDKIGAIDLEQATLNKEFVEKNFQKVPSEFFKYREGYVNQSGVLAYRNIQVFTECDSKITKADFVSFTAGKNEKLKGDIAQCGSWPYLLSYSLKSQYKNRYLKSAPDGNAPDSYLISDSLTKIKSLEHGWFYVANYDESKANGIGDHRGYIESKYLDPIN